MKVHTRYMDQYDGELTPDLRSGTFTCNGVTVRMTVGDATALSPEQIRQMVERIQRALQKQRKRNEDGSGGGSPPEP